MKKEYKTFRRFVKAMGELKEYHPKDKFFTSDEEIEYISNLLDLKHLSVEEMRDMRNMVVIFYNNLMEGLSRNDSIWGNYWQGMLSVTAIIDHVSNGATA